MNNELSENEYKYSKLNFDITLLAKKSIEHLLKIDIN